MSVDASKDLSDLASQLEISNRPSRVGLKPAGKSRKAAASPPKPVNAGSPAPSSSVQVGATRSTTIFYCNSCLSLYGTTAMHTCALCTDGARVINVIVFPDLSATHLATPLRLSKRWLVLVLVVIERDVALVCRVTARQHHLTAQSGARAAVAPSPGCPSKRTLQPQIRPTL